MSGKLLFTLNSLSFPMIGVSHSSELFLSAKKLFSCVSCSLITATLDLGESAAYDFD